MSPAENSPFARAVLAIDTGHLDELRTLITAHPDLANEVGPRRDGDYFAESSLLHHVAWNPFPSYREYGLDTDDPARMPKEMPDIVNVLLEVGADPNRRNGAGHDVVALLLTGSLASEATLTRPILEALIAGGAKLEHSAQSAHGALANHCPEGARVLIDRGVPWDVRIAAGLGELERLQSLVESRKPGPKELGLAAIHAYIGHHHEALDWLLALELDVNVIGVQEGTLLHRACAAGDLALIKQLTEIGADHNHRGNSFRATPLDWADHAGQTETVRWIAENAESALDLFQAAAHGLDELARRIVREDPRQISIIGDVWSYPAVQPLRLAVLRGHRGVAKILVDRGAKIDHVGGDGRSALDEARAAGDAEMLRILPSAKTS